MICNISLTLPNNRPLTMGTRVPSGSYRKFEKLGTAGYLVSARKKIGYRWIPGTDQNKIFGHRWVSGTGQKKNFGYRWVPRTGQKKNSGTDGYRVPARKKKFGYRWVPGTGKILTYADP